MFDVKSEIRESEQEVTEIESIKVFLFGYIWKTSICNPCDVFVPVSYCRLRHFELVPRMKEFLDVSTLPLNSRRLKHNQRNASNVPAEERKEEEEEEEDGWM